MGGDSVQMSRFFVNESDVESNIIIIRGTDVNHIKNVLRCKCGDKLTLCNGKGIEYNVLIKGFENGEIHTSILSKADVLTEPSVEVTLFQGLPKSDKMDLIIQKSVELGVNKIVPVVCERSVVKISSTKDADSKVSRWKKISAEAAGQCDRGIIPAIEYPVSFGKALNLAEGADFAIIPYEMENKLHLKEYLLGKSGKDEIHTISVIIGPEGGFTDKEIENAIMHGVRPVSLGPRILRTETAGIAVMAAIMFETGNM